MNKKIADTLTAIFAVLLTIGLIAGLIISILFVIGFVIGGDTAAKMCGYITLHVLPYEYKLAEIIAVIGMVKMYLCREKTFVMDTKFSSNK